MSGVRGSISFRLTVGLIAVIVTANTVVSALTVVNIGDVLLEEVQTRVRLDLDAARQVYEGHARQMESFLQAVSLDRFRIAEALQTGNAGKADRLLEEMRASGRMDILRLLDSSGRVLWRGAGQTVVGDSLASDPVVARVLATRKPASGTVIVPHSVLAWEGTDLAARAVFELQPTPAAKPTDRTTEVDGMAITAAQPLLDADGRLIGILSSANLLNRRFDLVDDIKNTVFQGQTWQGKDIGTATIFQKDLRIATNVLTERGERAVGTLLSAQVYDAVLERGEVWADRAFVVNDWYITAYEPIRDPHEKVIGVLYVGLLEEPFSRPQHVLQAVFLAIMAFTTLLSLAMAFAVTRNVLKPVSRIVHLAGKIKGGDLSARVDIRPPGEMGVLCEAIDRMADAVVEREEKLKELTRRQIGQSEKLASVGRLAAGVAHEINNPLTGVLTFSHLLKEKTYLKDQDRQDLDVIIRETTRVREIVRSLLDFARAAPSVRRPVDLNQVISQTIRLFRSQKDVNIAIEERFDAKLPQVAADPNQLQQVFLNLSLNAWEAMPQGGRLTFTTLRDGDQAVVRVEDSGCGIPPEHLDKIFDPFFTTKEPGKGTGLGLSVSYGIVQQHGGTMLVESQVGTGTTFTVLFPAAGECPGEET